MNFKKIAGAAALLALGAGVPFAAFAGSSAGNVAPNSLPTPVITSLGGLITYICNAINWVFTFLVILTILFIIIAAFKYLTSAGDPDKVKSANNQLIYAAIAVAVALVAKGIPLVVAGFLGASQGQTSSVTSGC
jgi:hypothetical protein